jgi:poly(U)-specific endoribonuclease
MRRRNMLGLLAGGAGGLAFPTVLLRRAEAGGPSAYQKVWDADQSHRGVPAILARDRGDKATGFVRVDEQGGRDPDHRVIAEVSIPEAKRETYDLVKALFDNYRLDQTKREDTTQDEAREMLALLEPVTDSAPMAEVKRQIGEQRGKSYSRDEFQAILFDIWFRQYDDGRNLDLSGFEHVVVGEQKEGTVSGYHFWYRYYLDDFGLLGTGDDIDFEGSRYPRHLASQALAVPDVVTLAYRWRAEDYDAGIERPLFKPTGGFWVGCSAEGLMALGVMRFFERGRGETVINRARYEIELYKSPDRKSIRSYFPIFKGIA